MCKAICCPIKLWIHDLYGFRLKIFYIIFRNVFCMGIFLWMLITIRSFNATVDVLFKLDQIDVRLDRCFPEFRLFIFVLKLNFSKQSGNDGFNISNAFHVYQNLLKANISPHKKPIFLCLKNKKHRRRSKKTMLKLRITSFVRILSLLSLSVFSIILIRAVLIIFHHINLKVLFTFYLKTKKNSTAIFAG